MKHLKVKIPTEKSMREVENGRYGNGYSIVAVIAAAMTRTGSCSYDQGCESGSKW